MYLLEKLRKLNLFVSPGTQNSENVELIHDQILSTRVYVFLLIALILTITLFTVVRPVPITETVLKPSLDAYLKLEAAQVSGLSCLCRQPTVKYGNFFSIEPIYHEVGWFPTQSLPLQMCPGAELTSICL